MMNKTKSFVAIAIGLAFALLPTACHGEDIRRRVG